MTDHGAEGGPSPAGPRGLAACAGCQEVFPAARLAEHGGRMLCGQCARSRVRSMTGDMASPPAASASPASSPAFPPADGPGSRFRPRAAPRAPLCGVEQVLADPFAATQAAPRPVPVLDDALPARPVLRNSRTSVTSHDDLPDWAKGAATAASHGRTMSPAEAAALNEAVASGESQPGLPTGFSRGARMAGSTAPVSRPPAELPPEAPVPQPEPVVPPPPFRGAAERTMPAGFQSGSRFSGNTPPMQRPQDATLAAAPPQSPLPPPPQAPMAPAPFVRGRGSVVPAERPVPSFAPPPPVAADSPAHGRSPHGAPQFAPPPPVAAPPRAPAAPFPGTGGPGRSQPAAAHAPHSGAAAAPAGSPVIQGKLSRASIPPWELENTPAAAKRDSRTSVTGAAHDGPVPAASPPVAGPAFPPAGHGPGASLATAAAPSAPTAAAVAAPARAPSSDRAARIPANANFEDYAVLRQRIDAGEDTSESHRAGGDLAARLGLHLEAIEHYRRCLELDPADERSRIRLDNARLAVSNGAGASPEAARAAAVPRKIADEAAPFWLDLQSAVAYPLQGAGKSVIFVGGVLFGLSELITSINMFGGVLWMMLWGYVAAYLFDVINSSGTGKTAPPELPEPTNVLESYVFPFFAYLTCGLVSFSPFVVMIWAAFKGWLPAPVAAVLLVATFALGFFVMPMTLMVRAMFQSIGEAATPAVVLGSIGRIFPDYVAMFVATCITWISYGLVWAVLYAGLWFTIGRPDASSVVQMDGGRIVAWVLLTVVSWPLFLYAWIFQGHLLGRLYRQGLRRLAWFVPPSDATLGARKLSRGLAIGAGCALVALCGAAYGAGTMMQRIVLHPNAGAFGASCPVGNGSSLTYFWEHTDGMAGLTTYTFQGQADGTVRVTASTRIAGENGPPSGEVVGIFDPDNGIWHEAATAWGAGVHHDGKKGQHVAFYGPKHGSEGSAYINEWMVKEPTRWRKEWQSWRVHDDVSTTDRYYDTKTGILVGSEYRGVGFVVTEWLVSSENVRNCPRGIAPNRDFTERPEVPDPYEGFFEGMEGR